MSEVSGTKLQVNVMMNKQKTKVLFAEANNDFVDVLFSFLALPLGKVASIIRKHNREGQDYIGSSSSSSCLNTLYTGLLNLDDAYFISAGAKQMLLDPPSSSAVECRNLKLDCSDSYSSPLLCFVCQDQNCPKLYGHKNMSLYCDIATCECGKPLNREVSVREAVEIVGSAFTSTNPSSFIITDDLLVAPITGIIQTLNSLATADVDRQRAEMISFSFGIDEIRDLLKFSVTSSTPLTDTIIKKTQTRSSLAAKPEPLLNRHVEQEDGSSRKMALKVCLQKSTDKFLFAIATDEFVELLFSFLTIPLGGVEFLLGGKIGLPNIDNLYGSVSNGSIDQKYLATPETKDKLINPKLPHGCGSKNQFLPLGEDSPPKLKCKLKSTGSRYKVISLQEKEDCLVKVSSFKSSKENYVKKQTMCFVGDDLTVSPCLATGISILKDLGVPFHDVKEMELQIGVQEALRILKASLASTTAITDALIKPMLKLDCNPKQEPQS